MFIKLNILRDLREDQLTEAVSTLVGKCYGNYKVMICTSYIFFLKFRKPS